jgi:hypothetical protein
VTDAEKIERLRRALAFYAEPGNWLSPSSGFALQYDPDPSPLDADRGELARLTLTATE